MDKPYGRFRNRVGRVIGGVTCFVITSTVVLAADEVKPIDSTMSYKLLGQERDVRELPPNAEQLLRDVINDATLARIIHVTDPRGSDGVGL